VRTANLSSASSVSVLVFLTETVRKFGPVMLSDSLVRRFYSPIAKTPLNRSQGFLGPKFATLSVFITFGEFY
jgi:hypothetical protein